MEQKRWRPVVMHLTLYVLQEPLKTPFFNCMVLPRRQKKNPVDFDDELEIGDVRYDNMTQITIKEQLFWRLSYETWLC